MARKQPKRGPKPQELDWDLIKRLAVIHCTRDEIASVLNVSHDTLERACKDEYKTTIGEKIVEWSASGKASLRRIQWKLAETNPTMAIFLGKQHLGQKDEQALKYSGNLKSEVVHYGDKEPKKWQNE
jgi:trehalose-6-phosphatase